MLTNAIKEAIERAGPFPLATATAEGLPNVVPVKYLEAIDDHTLWITDNYLGKTLANLGQNPRAAVYVWSPEPKLCVQIKGTVEVVKDGAEYERMKEWVRQRQPDLPARSLVILRIQEIYDCLPGPDAGKRIFP